MIRKATINDVKSIYDIFSETLTPWSEQNIISSVNRDFILVYEEESIEGVIVFSRVLDECELLNFAVLNEKRGKGIGKELLKTSLSDKFLHSSNIFLEVRESNTPAISLYKKMGFETIGTRKNYYANPQENAVLMKLDNF